MEMTFDNYIINPMGIKNSVYSNKEMYRNLYMDKLNKILVRESGNVRYKLYYDKEGNYYIHMNVPSEVIKDFYYDVVIMFYTNNDAVKLKRTLKEYSVKFYSNDPSFVFTFAHAMLENDLFIKDLVPRMSKEAVKKAAVERNPKNEIGYVKSLYFTYLLMTNYGLFQKIKFESEGEKYNKKNLLSIVVHSDIKIELRQEKGKELQKSKGIEKKKAISANISKNNSRNISSSIGITGKVSMVSRVKKATSNIKVSTVKRASSIKK